MRLENKTLAAADCRLAPHHRRTTATASPPHRCYCITAAPLLLHHSRTAVPHHGRTAIPLLPYHDRTAVLPHAHQVSSLPSVPESVEIGITTWQSSPNHHHCSPSPERSNTHWPLQFRLSALCFSSPTLPLVYPDAHSNKNMHIHMGFDWFFELFELIVDQSVIVKVFWVGMYSWGPRIISNFHLDICIRVGSCSGYPIINRVTCFNPINNRVGFVSNSFMQSGRPGWHEPDPWT
jgi:hypothetical protein